MMCDLVAAEDLLAVTIGRSMSMAVIVVLDRVRCMLMGAEVRELEVLGG